MKHGTLSNYNRSQYKDLSRTRARYVRGFTLIELSIAMSIGALIIAGLSIIVISASRTFNVTQSTTKELLDAKTLSLSIDNVIDKYNGDFTYIANNYENNSSYKEISKEDIKNESILFSIYNENNQLVNYIFCNQNFGYYFENDKDFAFKNIYTTQSKIKLNSALKIDDSGVDLFIFSFSYGQDQQQVLRLSKSIERI